MKIVVTGGDGFIGSPFVRHLPSGGEARRRGRGRAGTAPVEEAEKIDR